MLRIGQSADLLPNDKITTSMEGFQRLNGCWSEGRYPL